MKKTWLIVVSVFLLFSSFMFSKSLTIWIGGQVAELDETWDEIISKFEANTGVKVEVQLFGFDTYYDHLVTALQGGIGPDLAFADLGGWVPTFAAHGWIEQLDDKLTSWEGTNQIWENLWPTVTYQGKRYGLPWYTDDRLLMYNKQMFKDAGLDPENPPKTWEEFLYVAMKLTNPSKRIYGYGVSGTKTEHTTLGYMMFLYSTGGQLLTNDYKKAAFNTEEGLRALKFYTDLALKYEVSPNPLSYNEDDYRNLMAQNRVAMSIGGPWSFPLIETANPNIDYSVSVHPYAVVPASVLGGWALIIPSSSKNKDIAWELASYLTSYETWMLWIEKEHGPMPTRKDVAKNSPYFQQNEKWQVVFDVFPHAVARPPIPEWPQVSEQIQIMVQNVLLGKSSPEEAIKIAESNVNKILAGN
mgnify:FL=1